jgi:hypothetical protein
LFIQHFPPNFLPTLNIVTSALDPLPSSFSAWSIGPNHLEGTTLNIEVAECGSQVFLYWLEDPASF